MARQWIVLLLLGLACCPCLSGRVSPDEVVAAAVSSEAHAEAPAADDNVDFQDGDDPSVRSHWALLVAGSAGWGNYRHQADVLHAYHVLRSGGYRADHIVVMAYDDIANNPENPMPGKVFNRPGGPDVYSGVKIDYSGDDVNAATFLAVLEGDTAAVAGKGTGRVVASGPNDKVFLFYSDHGAAGVLGMPSGPFLYADELLKSLRKKFHKQGFKEMVMYIEACESGSMFEGLLDDNMAAYVTTAANAYESSWATYCPEFFLSPAADGSSSNSPTHHMSHALSAQPAAMDSSSAETSLVQWLVDGMQHVQQWFTGLFGMLPAAATSHSQGAAAASAYDTAQAAPPTPQFYTCLGDLYSVAWLEDAETSDLTTETLLQQYKVVKKRTSQNFTYEQGSHVMQYGDLDIDEELVGDYQGMLHNGSVPPTPSFPSQEWVDFELQLQEQPRHKGLRFKGFSLQRQPSVVLQQHSSVSYLKDQLSGGHNKKADKHAPQHRTVEQRDADLLPLMHAARHAKCPKRRAAAAASLQAATSARQSLEAAAHAAVAGLIKQPDVGYLLLASIGWQGTNVFSQAHPEALKAHFRADPKQQPGQQQLLKRASNTAGSSSSSNSGAILGDVASSSSSNSGAILGDVASSYVKALMGPLPGREGQPLVDSWDCLRGMVQAWEGQCGELDQYGMKQTRLFANICNAGVQPTALAGVLRTAPCKG